MTAVLEAGLDDARAERRWADVAKIATELAGRERALESVVDIRTRRRW